MGWRVGGVCELKTSGGKIRNATSQGHKQQQLRTVYDCLKEQVLYSAFINTTPKKGTPGKEHST